jgi:CubicO group peptidase (beta-lactamase class C family)
MVRSRMLLGSALTYLALVAALGAGPAGAQAPTPGTTRALTAALQGQVAAKTTPGDILVLSENGKILYQHAEGVWETGSTQLLRPDTVFWTASLSKPITAVAILMLYEEGKVLLDDPVSRYIPEFAMPARVRVLKPASPPPVQGRGGVAAPPAQYDIVPADRSITIRDLLTHTSGLQSIGVPNTALPDLVEGDTLATWVPKLASVPLDFQPGSKWAYSNAVGFDVLSRIVEVASGETFDHFLKRRIFDPLEMRETGFGLVGRPEYAGRSMVPSAQLLADPRIKGNSFYSGAAGLWTTTLDYTHFGEMLVNGGVWHGRRLIKTQSVAMMTSEQAKGLYPGIDQSKKTPGFGFGFAVMLVNDPTAAGVAVPAGSFGWDGAGGKRFWGSPKQKRVFMGYATTRPAQAALEQAVMQAFPAK